MSCHLYPIRVGNYGPYQAVNYHRWDVCKAAVLLGKKENVPVYRFLKEPLIRKFGKEWYDELEIAVKEFEGVEDDMNRQVKKTLKISGITLGTVLLVLLVAIACD